MSKSARDYLRLTGLRSTTNTGLQYDPSNSVIWNQAISIDPTIKIIEDGLDSPDWGKERNN